MIFFRSLCRLIPVLLFTVDCWKLRNEFLDTFCVLVPENNYSTLVMKPDEEKCPPFDCWKSQLTNMSKVNLTWTYNKFRSEIAEKKGIEVMLQANWHWTLEKEAMKLLKNCPDDVIADVEKRDIGGLAYGMSCQITISTIPGQFKTQKDFVNEFPKLLREKRPETELIIVERDYFMLPEVSHFGCAVLFVQNGADDTRFACVHCFNENILNSSLTTCPKLYEKNPDKEFSNLCTHKVEPSMYGCEPAYLSEYCTEPQPKDRREGIRGSMRYIYVATDSIRHLLYFQNRSDVSEALVVNPFHTILQCEAQGGECPPQMAAWYYVYDEATMTNINSTIFIGSSTFVRYGNNNKITEINLDYNKQIILPPCCTIIFILFSLTFIVILPMVFYTYEHYKIHHRLTYIIEPH